jgi:N-acyl-phosphatidylethanolamine-hydrolysing phospholipase D
LKITNYQLPTTNYQFPIRPAPIRLANGRFRNPWPNSGAHGFRELFRWIREHPRAVLAPAPTRNSFLSATPAVTHPRAGDDVFNATWIGQATTLMQIGGMNVLTDPMFSERASPVQWAGPRRVMDAPIASEALPPIDVVLQSHDHYDHLDRRAVKRIARANPGARWITPLGVGARLRRWGARHVTELSWWDRTSVGALSVTAVPASHFSGRGFHDRDRSLWCGFSLELGGWRALFGGDSAYHPAFGEIGAACGPFDFVMLPIGAYEPRWFMGRVHMNPEDAVQAYQDLVAVHGSSPHPLMLGIHWGTFRLTNEPMDEPPKRTLARWLDRGLREERLWLARFGETRAVSIGK